MHAPAKLPISTAAKLFLWGAVVIGTSHLIDFAFYGGEGRDLLASIGFGLMAYGVFKNGLGNFRSRALAVATDAGGRHATHAGALLVVASLVLQLFAMN